MFSYTLTYNLDHFNRPKINETHFNENIYKTHLHTTDHYILSILTSSVHKEWVKHICLTTTKYTNHILILSLKKSFQ